MSKKTDAEMVQRAYDILFDLNYTITISNTGNGILPKSDVQQLKNALEEFLVYLESKHDHENPTHHRWSYVGAHWSHCARCNEDYRNNTTAPCPGSAEQ